MTQPISDRSVDVVVVGGGPAGMNAALETARLGRTVALIEDEPDVGGGCVRRGTIPSKTLRETAVCIARFSKKTGGVVPLSLPGNVALTSLYSRTSEVITAHERTWTRHLREAGVELLHGRAHFDVELGPHALVVDTVRRQRVVVAAASIVLATGSRPRSPDNVPVDHETVLDSDSILALPWLPKSLLVLGGGVIAVEYASIFSALGVEVTIIDKQSRPLGFLDEEIVDAFLGSFAALGGVFRGGRSAIGFDRSLEGVDVALDDGTVVCAEKVLFALGRVANVQALRPQAVGLAPDHRGFLVVDHDYRTALAHVFAVGDVIGPPSLASTAMEQGRRAGRSACGQINDGPLIERPSVVPVGVYSIPEMASVGISQADAERQGIAVRVGRASFADTARGVISASEEGMLKLLASADGQRILGVHVVGEGAAELVHLGQLAMLGGLPPHSFVEHAFNFPTLAEAYRIAALDLEVKATTTAAIQSDPTVASTLRRTPSTA